MIIGGYMFLRQELPYDFEIVPHEDKIEIFNLNRWSDRDLSIKYISASGNQKKDLISGKSKKLILRDLEKNQEYKLVISRNDIFGIRYKPKIFHIKTEHKPYFVLVGASIGLSWKIHHLPDRVGDKRISLGYRDSGEDGFDKENSIIKLINEEIKPDGIIVKECATYFPRNLKESEAKIKDWVALIRKNEIIPILVTCVPVTPENDQKFPGRQEAINKFNSFIRTFSEENNITLLDLQNALKDQSEKKYLDQKFARSDGLHLKEEAYTEALDPIVMPKLVLFLNQE